MRLPPGVPAILASVFAMALADAIIKQSSAGMTLWQIWVLRSALVLPVMLVMARGRVWPVPVPWVALRCLALVAMYLTMYPALPLIDMALDILAEELRLAQTALNSITGEFTSDDRLGVIFSSFCIGK